MAAVTRWVNKNKERLLTGVGVIATIYGGLVLWKDYLVGKRYRIITDSIPSEDLVEAKRKKVFLVTGANSGLGKEVTKELAKLETSKVYMLCRNMEKCEMTRRNIVTETKNKYIYCRPCDLANNSSIRECANEIKETEKRIDGLLNNAGVMFAPRSFSQDGIEIHWAVNHLGPYLLTKLLKDQLIGGRILYMINMDYRHAKEGIKFHDLNSDEYYSKKYAFYQSQLANVLMLQKLAEDFKGDFISVNGVYPGVCSNTNIKRHMSIDKSKLMVYITRPLLWLLERTAEEGAYTPVYLIQDKMAVGKTGKIFHNMTEMSIAEIGVNDEDAKKLIAVDDYWAGLKSKEEIADALKIAQK